MCVCMCVCGLVWFNRLTSYQVIIGYLLPKPNSLANV